MHTTEPEVPPTKQAEIDARRNFRRPFADSPNPRFDFSGDWRGLNFSNGDWSRSDFSGADLRSTDFSSANLNGANVTGACFWNANMTSVDLTGARGLTPRQLAGANLSNVRLPSEFPRFPALEYVKSISENAAKVFLTVLALAAFVLVTIASASDAQLILNTASTKLPLIGVDIPMLGFLIAAPLSLLLFHLYLHIYLQRLWDAMSTLPAIFPDARRLDETTYPWLINDLCRRRVRLLRSHRVATGRAQTFVSMFLVYWLVPLLLWFVWAASLRAQVSLLTAFHTVVFAAAVAVSIAFSQLMRQAFDALSSAEARPRWVRVAICTTCGLSSAVLLALWSFGVLTAEHDPMATLFDPENIGRFSEDVRAPYTRNELDEMRPFMGVAQGFWQRWGARAIFALRLRPYPQIGGVEFSTKPPSWTGFSTEPRTEFPLVKGAALVRRRLINLNAPNAFVVKAVFRDVVLTNCNFTDSDFRLSSFDVVDARGTRFDGVRFTLPSPARLGPENSRSATPGDFRTRWSSCNFDDASFVEAQMDNAIIVNSTFNRSVDVPLFQTSFTSAHLHGAEFHGCVLQKASFVNADLRKASFHNLKVRTDLTGAIFWSADCRGANFGDSRMDQVNLKGARLDGAVMDGVKGEIHVEVLLAAASLRGVRPPPNIVGPDDKLALLKWRIENDAAQPNETN